MQGDSLPARDKVLERTVIAMANEDKELAKLMEEYYSEMERVHPEYKILKDRQILKKYFRKAHNLLNVI